MKINTTFLKQVSILSILIGLIVGLITMIPFIGNLVFVLYFLALSSGLIVYLKKNNIIGEISVKEGSILGAVIGFTSMLGFYCSFIPIFVIISLITHNFLGAFIVDGFTNVLAFFTLVFLLFLLALLCSLMNGFAGGVTAYVYEFLANLQKEDNKFTLK